MCTLLGKIDLLLDCKFFCIHLNDNHLHIPSTTLFYIESMSYDHTLLIFLFHTHTLDNFLHYFFLCIFIILHFHSFYMVFFCGWQLHNWNTFSLHMFNIEHLVSIHSILFFFRHILRILPKILFKDTISYSDFSQFPNYVKTLYTFYISHRLQKF